ncbi:hypothetical protein [Paenibacillus sp. F4]|uniref:hypothetical protein n=1 Tax=Paenibacillus sp. F4 TaxID=357385 RepID=UPI0015E0ABEC|nr:hypothetical protein [Paenibacillus sp. F4]
MARRKSKAKQEEELFQGLAGMAMLGGIAGTYSLTGSWQAFVGRWITWSCWCYCVNGY